MSNTPKSHKFDVGDVVTPVHYPGFWKGKIINIHTDRRFYTVRVEWANGDVNDWMADSLEIAGNDNFEDVDPALRAALMRGIEAQACIEGMSWVVTEILQNRKVTIQELWGKCDHVEWLLWVIELFGGESAIRNLAALGINPGTNIANWEWDVMLSKRSAPDEIRSVFPQPPIATEKEQGS